MWSGRPGVGVADQRERRAASGELVSGRPGVPALPSPDACSQPRLTYLGTEGRKDPHPGNPEVTCLLDFMVYGCVGV